MLNLIQMCSMRLSLEDHEDFLKTGVTAINSFLPEEIRVLGIRYEYCAFTIIWKIYLDIWEASLHELCGLFMLLIKQFGFPIIRSGR